MWSTIQLVISLYLYTWISPFLAFVISRLRAWLCLNLSALSLQSTVFPDPSIEEPTSFNNTSNISGPPVSFSEDLQGPMASLPCVEGFSSVAHPPESSSIAKSFSKGKRSPSPVTPPSTKRIALSKSFVESPTTIGVKSLSSQGIRSKKKLSRSQTKRWVFSYQDVEVRP